MINKYDNVNQTYTHMINNNISNTDEDRQFTHHPRTHDSNGWKGGLVTLVGQGAYIYTIGSR